MPGKKPVLTIAIFAAVGSWLIYDLVTEREAQSSAVAMLQYVLLAGIAIGLVGALLKLVRPQ